MPFCSQRSGDRARLLQIAASGLEGEDGLDKKRKGLAVAERLRGVLPAARIKSDPLYTYAYSGDASFYRLVPALVVIVDTEDEVAAVLAAAKAEDINVTFRAAGTSLSGQAVTDGLLCVLGDGWRKIDIGMGGDRVTLGPATIVSAANTALKPFNRKIGPDPASQATAKIGGVVANNSSGMCCGVVQNTYHTMHRLRLMLTDGTVLDSGDAKSREAFVKARPDVVASLMDLAEEVRSDNELVDLIRRKYAIKNTVGYSLNALIDFTDPIDILTHLMVGSEGTLGFVAEVTYDTVPDHPFKATALVPYETAEKTAEAIRSLHHVGVSAAEFMERRALATVEDKPALAPYLPFLTETSPAVLVEIMATSAAGIASEIDKATRAMSEVGPLSEILFTTDPEQQGAIWDIRKGLFASAGASRDKGTTMLTEDVAVPIDKLPEVVGRLRHLLDAHGYEDAIIFGHALAGNLHFQMAENFARPGAADKFNAFCDDLAHLIAVEFGGSLKAEHGTGRAVAPYVEMEWGKRAYAVMERIKAIFDPDGRLNPGIILNDDAAIHVKNLKEMAEADDLIDLCIECGFCEPACPSSGLTLTPRQRIAVTREQARLEKAGGAMDAMEVLETGFVHAGMDTCAACNLCSLRCPVGIETGTMIMGKRAKARGGAANRVAALAASATVGIETAMGAAVGAQSLARSIVGDRAVDAVAGTLNTWSKHKLPHPRKSTRRGPGAPRVRPVDATRGRVLYFPACASRMFGSPRTGLDLKPVTEAMVLLIVRAGFQPVVPQKLTGQCCGQPFQSKGFPQEAQKLGARLSARLEEARGPGVVASVTDMSTCALHMQKDGEEMRDSAEFLVAEILPHLTITRRLDIVAVHHNCSAQRMDEQKHTEALAGAVAKRIAVLNSVTCCGFAGDKGLYQPEFNAHALRFARSDVPEGCEIGVTTVSTCAMGLSDTLGIPFVSLASLLEYASRP